MLVDHRPVASGDCELDLEPGTTAEVDTGLAIPEQGNLVLLNLRVELIADTDWASAGHSLAKHQWVLRDQAVAPPEVVEHPEFVETDAEWLIKVGNKEWRLDKSTGNVSQWAIDGIDQLAALSRTVLFAHRSTTISVLVRLIFRPLLAGSLG